MRISEVYSARYLASHRIGAERDIDTAGKRLFPAKKKMGLDLKWIVNKSGVPVTLMPSSFDAVSTIRNREGFIVKETEMPFFRESMLVKEADEQEIMRVQDASDPYLIDAVASIFDDVNTLIDGANIVPERMTMQLLSANVGEGPRISIQGDGATYSYNYDPSGLYGENLTKAVDWSIEGADPLKDLMEAQDKVEEFSGSRPTNAIMSTATFRKIQQSASIHNYILAQNVTANIMVTKERVLALLSAELGLTIYVVNQQYKDEDGIVHNTYPDGKVALIPNGALGNTWYGTTPEERTLMRSPTADVSIVNTGVAVYVTVSEDPVQTKTTVSEIVLPSFERMYETFVITANIGGTRAKAKK